MAAYLTAILLFFAVILTLGVVLVGTATGLIQAAAPLRVLAIIALLLFLFIISRAGGRLRRLATNVSDLIDAAGKIEAGNYGVQVAERGPRELRSLARAFNQMSARLADQDRERRDFVADLSHEFRTPLAIIRGQAEGIGDGVYPGDPAHLAPILDATHALETLVEALGTMTLADVGSLVLHREAVEVAVLINSSLAAFQSAADAVGVVLKADVEAGTPPVDADPARIRGVLANLLANAMRYTPAGGTVTVGARPFRDHVTISVTDTGQGIPDDLQAHVFERFTKGPGSPGSGLGLAIAKDIITAHGGSIEASSEVGKGTVVRFTLPVSP
jgi:two-component system, OmpR family, sensor histidine kinase BaeS